MERENRHTVDESVAALSRKLGSLKETKREGWSLKGIENPESVADHNYRVAIMSMIILDKYPSLTTKLEKTRVYDLIMVHDWGVIETGDVISERGKKKLHHDGKSRERTTVRRLSEALGSEGKRYINLWDEYNRQTSPEAQFVKQVEKLEMALQALEYEQDGYEAEKLDEFWENAEKYLEGKSLEHIFRELEKMRENSS